MMNKKIQKKILLNYFSSRINLDLVERSISVEQNKDTRKQLNYTIIKISKFEHQNNFKIY